MRAAAIVIVASVLIAGACTGNDDAAPDTTATTAREGAPAPPASDPTTTEPSTTTTSTLPPPPVVEPIPIDIQEDLGYAGAVALLPAQGGRGHVLVGYQAEEGQPSRPVLWESADGLSWIESSAPVPPDDQTVLGVTDGTYLDTALAIGGWLNSGDGPRAAVWLAADGRTFDAPPELPLGERTADIRAMSVSEVGLLVAGEIEDEQADTAFVAVRGPDGTWRQATTPELSEFTPSGIAAAGPTVVVTGTDTATEPAQARAIVSTDGAMTFQVAETSSLSGAVPSQLGQVGVTPHGFVAVACAPIATGNRTALARSVDGFAWNRQDITVVGDEDAVSNLDLDGAGCSNLRAEGDRVRVGVVDLADGWTLSIGPDGTADVRRTPRRPRSAAAGGPLVVPTAGGWLSVGRDTTGFTPSLLGANGPGTDTVGPGLPWSGPAFSSATVTPVAEALALQVRLYPEVEERSDGGYSVGPVSQWLESRDGRSFAPGTQPPPQTVRSVFSTPFGDFGLGSAFDAADDPDPGPSAGTEGFLRDDNGVWRSVGLIASGPGGELVADVALVGTGVVGVGEASVRDPLTNLTSTVPLARASVDAVSWWEESVPVAPGAIGGLSSACTLGDRVFAYGWQIVDGIEASIVAVRDPAGAWTVTAPSGIPSPTGLGRCETNGSRIVIVGSGRDRSTVWSSNDGITFTQADLSAEQFADTSFAGLEPIAGIFVIAGTIRGPDFNDDGAIWTSPDGLTWTEVPVDGLDGRNAQVPYDVALAPDGSLTIVGTDTGAVVAWNVPANAWSP